MSMAIRIVEVAVAEAHKAEARTIDEVEVEVGQLAGVMAEALAFCLEAAARGTMAEHAAFTLIQVPGLGHCLSCQHEVAISEFPAQCPDCHGYGVRIITGTELKIRAISVDEGEEKR
jgi:hydrogenase nickel incorporation protein HypA/HybF